MNEDATDGETKASVDATQARNQVYEGDRNKRILQSFIALVAVGIAVSFSIVYTAYSQKQSDLRWCELFVGLDDNYQSLPPGRLTPEQQDFARKVHKLRQELHCQATPIPPQPSEIQPSAVPATPSGGPSVGGGG